MRTYIPGQSFSPEFPVLDRENPEAAEFMLKYGAAKLANIFNSSSLEILPDIDFIYTDVEGVIEDLPELLPVLEFFGYNSDICSRNDFPTNKIPPEDLYDKTEEGDAHLDDKPNEIGISFLIPLTYPRAYFGASDTEFNVYNDDDLQHLWEYGPGDVMMLRQEVFLVNGKQYARPQTWHVGASMSSREIATIDFRHGALTLPVDYTNLQETAGVVG